MGRKLAVFVDGSEASKFAFRQAIVNKGKEDSLTIVNAFAAAHIAAPVDIGALCSAGGNFGTAKATLSHKQKAHALVERFWKECDANNIPNCNADIIGPCENIKDDACSWVAKQGFDLVFVGATGAASNKRTLIGSFATYLTQHVPCNVMVVRTR